MAAGALPDMSAVQSQQAADQAADNLSVSNSVTSLRAVGDADWSDIVNGCSPLLRLMLTIPTFCAEHVGTRDQTLHSIERLALRSGRSEIAVAQQLGALMRACPDATDARAAAGHWLQGPGRPVLMQVLGLRRRPIDRARSCARRLALPAYLQPLLVAPPH